MLVVVNGPIGAGKTTFAAALADELRADGLSAAVVGLDEVFFMVRSLPDSSLEEWWDLARVLHARLVGGFLQRGIDVAVVDGPFHDRERGLLLDGLESLDLADGIGEPVSVTLVVSYEEALRRVAGDDTRGLSKEPDFLRSAHDEFWTGHRAQPAPGRVLDAGEQSAAALAGLVATDLRRRPPA